jgi:hypothetical protein
MLKICSIKNDKYMTSIDMLLYVNKILKTRSSTYGPFSPVFDLILAL